MSTSTPIFRSSMGGFNKKDVTDYIARLNREYNEALSEKDNEISELSKKLAEAEEAAAAAGEASKNEASDELESANSLISAQNEQLEQLNDKVASLEAELAAVKAKLESYNTKVSQYDSMSNRMGEIYMEATADAERIRNEAKAASEELIAKTDAECKSRRSYVESQLSELAESRRLEISRMLSEAQRDIGSVLDSFEKKSKELVTVTMRDAGITAGNDTEG